MKINSCIYIVEGEVEENFINDVKVNYENPEGFPSGKISVFNIVQKKNIKKILRLLDKQRDAIIVVDSDIEFRNNFYDNIKEIKKYSKTVYILLQNECFEEELVKISEVRNMDELFKRFNAEGKSEFKTNYISSKTKITNKLNLTLDRYCDNDKNINITGNKVKKIKGGDLL